jgi:hypothetical protein
LTGEGGVGLLFILKIFKNIFKIIFWIFFERRKGAQTFLKLVKWGGNRVDFFVLENKMLKDGNIRWVGCGVFFLKALIVDGGVNYISSLFLFSYL